MSIRQLLAATLAFALCGAPELIQAQQAQSSTPSSDANTQAQQPQPADAPTQPSQQSPARQTNGTSQINGVNVDPSQGPLQPVSPESQNQPPPAAGSEATPAAASTDSSSQAQQSGQTETQNLPQNPEPQKPSEPVGAAAAQQGRTAGGAASKPAGMAIAPAKQGQMRSWLIRIGAIAAAGAAVGTIYALSRKTPGTPPGAQTGSFAIH